MKKSLQFIFNNFGSKFSKMKFFAVLFIMFSTLFYGQVAITPERTNVAGYNTTWTDTDVTGTNVELLKATSNTISPAMDFDSYTGEALSFKAKKQVSGGVAAEYVITVSISINNGSTWTILGTRTPINTISSPQASFNLSAYNGTQVRVKFSVAGTDDLVGVEIDNLKITGYFPSCVWNGSSWSNGVGPDDLTDATIDGAYTTGSDGDFIAKKLTITSAGSLTINSGTNVYVFEEVINNATAANFLVESNGNFLQINDVPVNVNVGDITVNRNTSPLKRLDYVLWSSPVDYQYLQSFSPSTLANRFYTYNSATNLYASVSSPSTTYFANGNGYLIRTPDNHSVVPAIWSSVFTGYRPNNGNVSVAVTANTYNAVGNPYPSTLDADVFMADNGITEALYFWRKTNNSANPSYATYTSSGGVANTGGGSALVPSSAIQVGQGFIAKSTSASLNFTNSMRVADNDNLFLRSSTTVDKSRIWLDLTNTAGLFCQTLIAYMPNATAGVDDGIDGKIFSQPANGATLTSIIGGDSSYIIQGRETFVDTDIVPLAFKTAVAGNFTISLSNVDGLFANNAQDIFLKDKLTNTITTLNTGDYTFATTVGDFLGRFEIVYQSSVLNVNDFVLNDVVVYTNNSDVIVNAGQSIIDTVKVYDLRGRLLTQLNNVNATETSIKISSESQILLVQVTAQNGAVVTKKIIK
jgi:hypothetical protein